MSVTSNQITLHNTPEGKAWTMPSDRQCTIFCQLVTEHKHKHFPSVTQSAGDHLLQFGCDSDTLRGYRFFFCMCVCLCLHLNPCDTMNIKQYSEKQSQTYEAVLAPLPIENWAPGLCAVLLKILWAKSRNLVSMSTVCFSVTATTGCGFHSYLSSVCCLQMRM